MTSRRSCPAPVGPGDLLEFGPSGENPCSNVGSASPRRPVAVIEHHVRTVGVHTRETDHRADAGEKPSASQGPWWRQVGAIVRQQWMARVAMAPFGASKRGRPAPSTMCHPRRARRANRPSAPARQPRSSMFSLTLAKWCSVSRGRSCRTHDRRADMAGKPACGARISGVLPWWRDGCGCKSGARSRARAGGDLPVLLRSA